MQIGRWAREHWKLVANIVTIVALLVLALAMRGQIAETFHDLTRVAILPLLGVIPVELLNYHAQAMVYRSLFRSFGNRIRYPYLFRLALELNFVNHLFPSGGVAGISYFGVRLRRLGISAGRSTLVQTMRFLLLFIAFEPLLLIGVVLLAGSGQVNGVAVGICVVLTVMVVLGTTVLVYVVGSRRRIERTTAILRAAYALLLRIVRLKREGPGFDAAERLLEEYHNDFLQIKSDYRQLVWPAFWSLAANITELAVLYLAYVAFGICINPGAVILAYAVANFAGLISIMPGGAGIYEGLMTLTLLAAGVSPAVSLPVTVMYRVLTMLLQLPPGFVLYQQALRTQGAEP